MSAPPPLEAGAFTAESFRARYQGRHPALFRDWLACRPLPAGELAELAGRDDLGSRLVRGGRTARNWRVDYGPLDAPDWPEATEPDWTVLVQDVDKVHPDAADLLETFDFIPRWCIDDIMVSQAGPGGSVGPHVDRYDVFLVQVAGRRRWQLARSFDPTPDPAFELALLQHFEPESEITAEPGDVLYLPPGVAHHGIAEEPSCQTWSVGLRTPSTAELLAELGEFLRANGHGERLPVPGAGNEAAFLPAAEAARDCLRGAVTLDPATWQRFLGETLTGYRLWHPENADDDPQDPVAAWRAGTELVLRPGARVLWFGEGRGTRLCVNGESRVCPPALAIPLARSRRLPRAGEFAGADRDAVIAMIGWLDALDALAIVSDHPARNA